MRRLPARLLAGIRLTARQCGHVWFELTRAEQQAVAVVLLLAILGLLVHSWRLVNAGL